MQAGIVKWFDDDKGFGFIEWEDEEIFVHYSDIQQDGYKTLNEGDAVEFDVEQTDRGPQAVRVAPANGSSPEPGPSEDPAPAGTQTASDATVVESPETPATGEPDPEPEPEPDPTPELGFGEMDFSDPVMRGIEAAGYETPRPIQVKAIPPMLEGRDVVGIAPTGTGKTAAFMLPILEKLRGTREENQDPRALILAPTHELADQITEETRTLASGLDVVVDSVYGGTDIWNEMERLEEGVDVLVACPGRLRDHIGRRSVDLGEVEVMVLDEADRMCDMGFLPEIKKIMRYLPRERANHFFSATIPPEIQKLARKLMDDPVKVKVGHQAPVETVSHCVLKVRANRKRTALKRILDNVETDSVLVFCRTRKTVRRLANKLRKQGYDASPLEGSMDSMGREATLSGFRRGSFSILVATNVAARGLDVEKISHVINYDVPEDPDVYTHRIGRTGRAGVEGDAYTLVTPDDMDALEAIERTIGYSIDRAPVPS